MTHFEQVFLIFKSISKKYILDKNIPFGPKLVGNLRIILFLLKVNITLNTFAYVLKSCIECHLGISWKGEATKYECMEIDL